MRLHMPRRHLATALLCGCGLYAQFDGGVNSGFGKDASSAAVPGATVAIRNEATGVNAHVKSNETGLMPAGVGPAPSAARTRTSSRAEFADLEHRPAARTSRFARR